jgi:hypothetical protein
MAKDTRKRHGRRQTRKQRGGADLTLRFSNPLTFIDRGDSYGSGYNNEGRYMSMMLKGRSYSLSYPVKDAAGKIKYYESANFEPEQMQILQALADT